MAAGMMDTVAAAGPEMDSMHTDSCARSRVADALAAAAAGEDGMMMSSKSLAAAAAKPAGCIPGADGRRKPVCLWWPIWTVFWRSLDLPARLFPTQPSLSGESLQGHGG